MRYIISLGFASFLAAGASMAEVPRVVTDIHPVHALVAQVMGDRGEPALLLGRGADEHAFQLRPSQAAALAEADVVFWVGPELTPWLERALDGVPADVAQVELLAAAGVVTQGYGEAAGHAAHAGEEGHAAEEGHAEREAHAEGEAHAGEEAHGHDGVDPHAWLSPTNAVVWLGVIAAELSRLDPENAGVYAANAAAAAAEIAALDAEVTALLAPLADQPIVVFHEAFGYFSAHYGLQIAGSVAEGDAAAPGAARMVALRDLVAAGGAVCVFPEVQHDPALMAQLVEGTEARIGGALDPVGSSLEPGAGLYRALLVGMATVIADCLRGP